MSQMKDLQNAFKDRINKNQINPDVAVDLLIDVLDSLEWDIEDCYLPNGVARWTTPYSEYIEHGKAAVREMLGVTK